MSDELDEIQAIFFEECAEGLAAAEAGLTAIAGGERSAAVIASVFRAVHSIKGGAGAFGHVALTEFAHRFENLLDEVRANRLPITDLVARTMLTALDLVSDHVAAARDGGALPDHRAALADLEALLASGGQRDAHGGTASAVDSAASPAAADPVAAEAAPDTDAEAADEFGFVPVSVDLESFDAPADEAAKDGQPDDTEKPAWIVRFAPSRAAMQNGGEPLLVVRELESLGGELIRADISALPKLRDLEPEESYVVWTVRMPADTAESEIRDCFDFVAPDSVIEITREEPATEMAEVEVAPVAVQLAAVAGEAPPSRITERADPVSQSIRVDLPKLDLLLNLVGELVIRNSILSDRLAPKDQERVELPELARLTREIQDNVMSLRAQPIRQAFSRVPRMLRDLAAETGKHVELETLGETTEVDKAVIEKIGDPLTHLIRNAVDHGIESAADRLAAGKPANGTIRLSAEQKGARILVRISDDGRGIDRVAVREKAIEKGLIAADAQLSNEEIDQLICAPGFSTARTISAISGRGVGMDVVRSNVESLGGRVEISSTPGGGTTFTLILPLTLAILDGMIVQLAGQRYVLPLGNVVEAIQPVPGQVQSLTPGQEVIDMRGHYLPIRRLAEMFGTAANDLRAPEESLVIIVESETAGLVGLLVDTIDDRREVVIKSLDQNLHPIRGLGGATILGDGSIALILDIEALVAPQSAMSNYSKKGIAA